LSGDCSTIYDIERLPWAQVYTMEAYKMGSWDAVCQGKSVNKIVKTKDFNRCRLPRFVLIFPSTANYALVMLYYESMMPS
jgi:hypothetical protein